MDGFDWKAKAQRLAALVSKIADQPYAEHCFACLTALDMNSGEPHYRHADDCAADDIDALVREIRFGGDDSPRSPLDNHPRGDGS